MHKYVLSCIKIYIVSILYPSSQKGCSVIIVPLWGTMQGRRLYVNEGVFT